MQQIYYKMNFIKGSFQIFSQHFKSIYPVYFWKHIYCFTQKMYVSEYDCKICQKELAVFLKCW